MFGVRLRIKIYYGVRTKARLENKTAVPGLGCNIDLILIQRERPADRAGADVVTVPSKKLPAWSELSGVKTED
jgi:hypothetical protein